MDAERFDTLVATHHREIYRYLARTTFRTSEADDLAQETFLRAYRAHRTLPPDANARAWLFAIATNVARNHFRTESRRRHAYATVHAECSVPTRTDPRDRPSSTRRGARSRPSFPGRPPSSALPSPPPRAPPPPVEPSGRERLETRLADLRRRALVYRIFPSPLGPILIARSEEGVTCVEYLVGGRDFAHSRLARMPGVEPIEDGAEVEGLYA